MKLKLTTLAVAAILVAGCGSASKEERVKSFNNQINTFKSDGFDVSQVKKDEKVLSYKVSVKDNQKAANYILAALNMQSLPKKFKEGFGKRIDDLGVDVDTDKLANNKEDSVYVYLLDNKKIKDGAFKKLVQEKKIGAYLTLNEKEQVKKIRVNDLDFMDKTAHITLNNFIVDFKKPISKDSDAYEYTLNLKSFKIDDTKSKVIQGTFVFNGINCEVSKSSLVVGEYKCNVKDIKFDTNKSKEESAFFEVKNIVLDGLIKEASGDLLDGEGKIGIDSLVLNSKSTYRSSGFTLEKYKLNYTMSGYSKSDMEKLMKLAKNDIYNDGKAWKEYMSIAAKMYSNLSAKGTSSFKKFAIEANRGSNNQGKWEFLDYKGDFDIKFAKVIDYISHTSTGSIDILYNAKGTPVNLKIANYKDTFEVKKLYNIMPELLKITPMGGYKNTQMSKDYEKNIKELMQKFVQSGGEISFSPITVDKISLTGVPKPLELKNIDLGISANLKENKIDFNNPMLLKMELMKSTDLNAHIVLTEDDYKSISTMLPPTMIMMAGTFAKHENGKVVFKIESKDGHLLLNGKPLM